MLECKALELFDIELCFFFFSSGKFNYIPNQVMYFAFIWKYKVKEENNNYIFIGTAIMK